MMMTMMTTFRMLGNSFIAAAMLMTHLITVVDALQFHFGDVSYASGLYYDARSEVMYITGQVGPNGAFVGVIKDNQVLQQWVLPEAAIGQDIIVDTMQQRAYITATTEEGGLFTDVLNPGSTASTQYGLVVEMQWNAEGIARLPGGVLLHQDAVQYPKAIVADPNDTSVLFVASMHSLSNAVSEELQDVDANNSEHPNFTSSLGSAGLKYGSHYYLQLERLEPDTAFGSNSLGLEHPTWRKPYGLSAVDAFEEQVEVAKLLHIQGNLVVLGHTRGSGMAFGSSQASTGPGPNTKAMNVFITKFDPTNGLPVSQSSTNNGSNLLRFSLGADVDTYVTDVCTSSDPLDPIVYMVGYKSQAGSTTPYVSKINIESMAILWQEAYTFTSAAQATTCQLMADGQQMVVGGIVRDGGTYANIGTTTVSYGGDDIFAMQLNSNDGHLQWMQQLGTQGQDTLVDIVVNNNRAQIWLYGDTTGDFRTTNTKGSEIFLVPLDISDGAPSSSWATTEISGVQEDGGSSFLSILKPQRTDGGASTTQTGEEAGTGGDTGTSTKVGDSETIRHHGDTSAHTGSYAHTITHHGGGSESDGDGDSVTHHGGSTGGGHATHYTHHGEAGESDGGTDGESITHHGGGNDEDSSNSGNSGGGHATHYTHHDGENDEDSSNSGNSGGGHATHYKHKSTLVEESKQGSGKGIGMAIALSFLFLVFVIGYCLRSRRKEKTTQRATVFSYLHSFDLEDIEVRHSATGGWHGTYVGDLAKGEGAKSDSHSSIVKDSLFLDFESRPRYQDNADMDQTEEEESYSDNFRIGSADYHDDNTEPNVPGIV